MAFSFLKPGRPTNEDDLNDLKLRVRALEALPAIGQGEGGNYGDYVLSLPDLLAYYPLQEGSGDVHAADHAGYLTQAPNEVSPPPATLTYGIAGPGGTGIEKAIDFESKYNDADAGNGKGAMFENTGGDPALGSTVSILTACAWVKPNATQDPGGNGPLIGSIDGTFTVTSGWAWWINSSLILDLVIGLGPGSGLHGGTAGTPLVPGVWSFVAYTFEQGTHIRKLYINGTLDQTDTTNYSANLPGGGTPPGFMLASGNVGAAFVDRWTYYRGGMAGLAMFSATLTDAEIAAMYTQGISSQIAAGKVLEADGAGSSAFVWPNMRILAADPSTPNDGEFYFNSGDSTFRVWDGSAWVAVTLT